MSRASESDDAFDDLLWELDVTRVRPKPAPSARTAPQADPPSAAPRLEPRSVQPRSVQPRSVQPQAPRPVGRARLFHRRERPAFERAGLPALVERIAGSRVIHGAGAALLVGSTSVLVVIALGRA